MVRCEYCCSWDSLAASASSTKRWRFCAPCADEPAGAGRARRAAPGCPGPPRTGSPSAWRSTGCCAATPTGAGARARAGRAGRRRARPAADRGRPACWPRCATPPARARSSTGATAPTRVCVAAAERDQRPARHRAGRRPAADDGRLRRPGARAWADPATQRALLPEATFTERTLLEVRRRGWAQSVAEREAGVACVSAPVRDAAGTVRRGGLGLGPGDRIGRRPGARWAADLVAAADALQHRL